MYKLWSRRLLEVPSRSAVGSEHDSLVSASFHSFILERMTGGHQGVHQRVGRFVVPRLEKSPVVDVGAQFCRLH
eukprot:4561636-Heterocapsa_arctica.AAC.1